MTLIFILVLCLQLNSEYVNLLYIIYCPVFLIYILAYIRKIKFKKSILHQILLILILITLFIGAALKNNYLILFQPMLTRGISIFYLCIILDFFLIYLFYRMNKHSKKRVLDWLVDNRVILGCLLAIFLVRIYDVNSIFRWDAAEYFNKLVNASNSFDFSFRNTINSFQLAKHPTIGLSFVYSIGVFLFPKSTIGVNLISLILILLSIYCIYQMSMIFTKNKSVSVLISLCVAALPQYMGCYTFFSPDLGLAAFFIIFCYTMETKRYILSTFLALIIMQTKETGLIILAGYGFGLLMKEIITLEKYELSSFFKIMKMKNFFPLYIALFEQILYMMYIGGFSAWRQNKDASTSFRELTGTDDINAFGFQSLHIEKELQQFFILNFQWIIAIIFIVVCFIKLRSRSKKNRYIYNNNLLPLYTTTMFLLIFSMFYVTYELPRYKIVFAILFTLLTCIEISKFISIKNFKFLLAIIICCFTAQSLISVDPLSSLVFEQRNTNTFDIYYANADNRKIYYGDTIMYNHQYMYIDKALDYILNKENYDENKDIIFYGDMAGIHLNGNGEVYKVYWDKSERKRVMFENENTIEFSILNVNSLNQEDKKNSAIFINLPHYEIDTSVALTDINKYYTVNETGAYISLEAIVPYYSLTLK